MGTVWHTELLGGLLVALVIGEPWITGGTGSYWESCDGNWVLWAGWELLGNMEVTGNQCRDCVHRGVTGRTGGHWGTGMGCPPTEGERTGCTGSFWGLVGAGCTGAGGASGASTGLY